MSAADELRRRADNTPRDISFLSPFELRALAEMMDAAEAYRAWCTSADSSAPATEGRRLYDAMIYAIADVDHAFGGAK